MKYCVLCLFATSSICCEQAPHLRDIVKSHAHAQVARLRRQAYRKRERRHESKGRSNEELACRLLIA